jgi:DinB superfamily
LFSVELGLEVLERTPAVLRALLEGLSPEWTAANEGPDTWSPYDVIGHLIHGERTDWMARVNIILQPGGGTFHTFDRFAQFRESQGKSLSQLLDEFSTARRESLAALRALKLTDVDLEKTGTHPKFGTVTLRALLSTWVAHDMDHLMQISRVMGKQLKDDVGPWTEYLRVVRS